MPTDDDKPRKTVTSQVAIRDFGGMKPNLSPHDLEPGESVSQVNVAALRRGELRVRQGFAVVQFRG